MIQNPVLQTLFKPTRVSNQIVPGTMIVFQYQLWKNDPYPMIIVSKVIPGQMIWGVNLHYLTFYYIRNLLKTSGTGFFSYPMIKNDRYIMNAFRSYKWNGIQQVKILDSQFLSNVMNMVRSFDPAEVEIIRRQVQEQLQRQINPTPSDLMRNANG